MSFDLIIIEPEKTLKLTGELNKISVNLEKYNTIEELVTEYSIDLSLDAKTLIPIYKGNIIDLKSNMEIVEENTTLVLFEMPTNKKIKQTIPSMGISYPITSNPLFEAAQNLLMTLVNNTNQENNLDIGAAEENDEIPPPPPGLFPIETNSFPNSISSLLNTVPQNTNLYVDELKQLEAMGFYNKIKNIEALTVSDGNVEQAVNYLVSSFE